MVAGELPAHKLSTREISMWHESLRDLTPKSRNSYRVAVQGFCRWLVRQRILRCDPSAWLSSRTDLGDSAKAVCVCA